MKIGALFSGGKDSMFALHWARLQGWDVCCLLSMKSVCDDSWMFHTPNIDFVKEQAASIGLPLIVHETNGEKEIELNDLRKLLEHGKKEYGIRGVVTGAVASEYQRMRINTVCNSLNLKVFSPLWHKKPEEYLHEITSAGYSFILTHVAAEGLNADMLGMKIDDDSVAWFIEHCKKHSIHPAGEGGEYESFVVDGPVFTEKMKVMKAKKHWDGVRGTLLFNDVRREKKE